MKGHRESMIFFCERGDEMSILDTIKKVMPYLKTDSGYVLCRLSSQAVEMDDGLTLEQKVTSLNSLIESKVDTSSVVNNALTTEEGFVLDARQGKVMDDKITELNGKLNSKSYDISSINLKSAWEVRYSDIQKIGRLVIFHARIYAGTILALHEYTINAAVDSDLIPASTTPVIAIAGDIYMQHTVACKCTLYGDGLIKLEVPDSGKCYIDISCVYMT